MSERARERPLGRTWGGGDGDGERDNEICDDLREMNCSDADVVEVVAEGGCIEVLSVTLVQVIKELSSSRWTNLLNSGGCP